jgi:hypothetical protein
MQRLTSNCQSYRENEIHFTTDMKTKYFTFFKHIQQTKYILNVYLQMLYHNCKKERTLPIPAHAENASSFLEPHCFDLGQTLYNFKEIPET